MASTLAAIHDLAEHPRFLRTVTPAMVKAAVAVGAEVNDQTQRGLARHALSVNVLRNPGAWAPSFAWAVAANPVITLDSSDGDVEFTVNSVWDAVAGADPVTPAP